MRNEENNKNWDKNIDFIKENLTQDWEFKEDTNKKELYLFLKKNLIEKM